MFLEQDKLYTDETLIRLQISHYLMFGLEAWMNPEYIIIHTAAFKGNNCDANMIDQWHRARGWSEIGYHFVILNNKHDSKPDGLLEEGRPVTRSGAHARGLNDRAIGICCIGHGDREDFTTAQYKTLSDILYKLMKQYSIPVENVIGHRELNSLIEQGLLSQTYRTSKSCPGKKVDLHAIRQTVAAMSSEQEVQVSDSELRKAIRLIRANKSRFGLAQDELLEFLFHPEVIELLDERL